MGESPHTRQSALLYQVIDLPCTEPNLAGLIYGEEEPRDREKGEGEARSQTQINE